MSKGDTFKKQGMVVRKFEISKYTTVSGKIREQTGKRHARAGISTPVCISGYCLNVTYKTFPIYMWPNNKNGLFVINQLEITIAKWISLFLWLFPVVVIANSLWLIVIGYRGVLLELTLPNTVQLLH